MKDPIVDLLAKIRLLESKEILNEFTAPPALKAGGKFLGKALPGVGLALAAQDAYSRQQAGDTTGAAISAATGAASSIPVVGTAASLIGTGVQAIRDKMRTGSWMPDEQEIATAVAKDGTAQPAPATAVAQAKPAAAPATPAPPGADPKVLALQQQLIAKGAKITADGKMGPATQAAMKQFPGTAVAEQFKGTTMSEAQKLAELRNRLAQIESTPQNTNENWATDAWKAGASKVGQAADGVKSAWGATKNFVGGAKAGMQGGTAASNVASGAANLGKAGDKGLAAAQAVKGAGQAVKTAATSNTAKNIAKVGAGAAAGAAGMAVLGGAGTKPTDPVKTPAAPAPAPAPAEVPSVMNPPPFANDVANASADPADVDALNAMAAELENSKDPADIEMMKRYSGLINSINNAAPGEKRTAGQVAANADLAAAGT